MTIKRRLRLFDLAFAAAGGLLLLFIVAPLASLLLGAPPAALVDALVDAEVVQALGVTFLAAALATCLALLTGVPLAYLLARRRFRGKRLIQALVTLPVVVPHTSAGVALLLVFGRRGLLGGWLAPLGLLFTDSLWGVVVAMLFVSLPFLVTMSTEAFALVGEEMEGVAQTDGATPWQAFWLITLPQAGRGVLGGALMMWARGISEFGAVVILAYNPKVVPVLVFERFQGYGLSAAQPVAAVLIVVALLVFALLRLAFLPEKE